MIPTPKELIDAERESNRMVDAYREGRGITYDQCSFALSKAQQMREEILNAYRTGRLVMR